MSKHLNAHLKAHLRAPKTLLATLLASPLILAGCGSSSSSSSGDTGTVSVAVTDAPVDSATSVVVTFTGVALKPSGGSEIEILFDEPKQIDLLALQGSRSEGILDDYEVPAGDYNWVRLMVSAEQDGVMDSYLTDDNGAQTEIYVPSGSQRGLQLVSGFTVMAGTTTDFTIDFDLRKSLTNPNGQDGIKLNPALRLIDNAQYGTITGTIDGNLITETCADASINDGAVYAFTGTDATLADTSGAETDPLTTALVSYDTGAAAYTYELGFMPVGDYTLAYTCQNAEDDPEAVDEIMFNGSANVTVVSGETETQDFVAQPD